VESAIWLTRRDGHICTLPYASHTARFEARRNQCTQILSQINQDFRNDKPKAERTLGQTRPHCGFGRHLVAAGKEICTPLSHHTGLPGRFPGACPVTRLSPAFRPETHHKRGPETVPLRIPKKGKAHAQKCYLLRTAIVPACNWLAQLPDRAVPAQRAPPSHFR